MFSNNLGTDANIQSAGPRFLLSVTRDVQSCLLFLKLVNASADAQTIEFGLLGAMAVKTTGKPVTLRATTKEATNSINNPTNTVPTTTTISGVARSLHHVASPYSIQVPRLSVNPLLGTTAS